MNMRLNELKSKTVISIHMKYQLSIKTNLLPPMINLHLISLNGNFSSRLKYILMRQNSTKIYLP